MNVIMENLGTIIVFLVLLAIVSLIVYRLIKNSKQGKSSCGCDCGSGGCPASGCGTMNIIENLQSEWKMKKEKSDIKTLNTGNKKLNG